jgi:hypothetical protein
MDRQRFIERAPHYYVLAIKEFFDGSFAENGSATAARLQRHYHEEDDSGVPVDYLENDILLARAIRVMVERDLLHVQEDDFGPALFSQADFANTTWDALREERGSIYSRYVDIPSNERRSWLNEALKKVNVEFMRLELKAADFEDDAKPDDIWEPLPIDRQSEVVQEVIKAIDDTAELVRQDNGYNSTVPQERTYVVEALNAVSKTFKEAQSTSLAYVRAYALDPLQRLIQRFGPSAIGAAAKLAKDTIYTWLKKIGVSGLELLFKTMFGS